MLLSCSGLFPTIHSNQLIANCNEASKGVCHIISTQFSLPFARTDKFNRKQWIEYRYKYFVQSAYKSIKEQLLTNKCQSYIWIIFVSSGDRKLLNLQACYLLDNGIRILWVEVAQEINKEDDYYRNIKMDSVCRGIAKEELNINKDISSFIFTRIDSDDFLNRAFIDITTAISCTWLKSRNNASIFFHYPCGITYDKRNEIASSRIWPEPSFVFYVVNSDLLDKSVWKWPHDKISCYSDNRAVITTHPMWCITTNHGNLANTDESYYKTKKIAVLEILDSMT